MIGLVVLRIVPYAAIGALIGAVFFSALRWNVRLCVGRGAGRKTLPLRLSRLGVAVAAFTLCAGQGATPLLASLAGFLAIRTISINRYGFMVERNP